MSQIKERKHIEQNFHYVAGIRRQGWDLGVLGVKTLAWGFAMAPHRLRVLVNILLDTNGQLRQKLKASGNGNER